MGSWIESILNDDRTFLFLLRGISAILLFAGISSFISTIVFLFRSKRAHGVLVAVNTISPYKIRRGVSSKTDSYPSYEGVVSFATPDGVEHHVKTALAAGLRRRPSIAVGHRMPVRYIPGRAEEARVSTIANLWLVPFICSAAGSLMGMSWLN